MPATLPDQRKVLKDCEQMISPSQDRVKEAYDDLSALVVSPIRLGWAIDRAGIELI